MGISIDRPELFKEKLRTGINLFTGAGFSVLPDATGATLPCESELCTELIKEFNLSSVFSTDLPALCALAPKFPLQNYLRSRFTVKSYAKKYDTLNKISLRSFITTNIDNIVHLIISNSNRYYLNSITHYGATKRTSEALSYLPLHGDVTDVSSRLYFGKFELADVDKANTDLFQQMHSLLLNHVTLFWGYGFHDSGVLKTISRLFEIGSHDIWIQCMPGDNKSIELFRSLRCNIIIADTSDLLDWIDSNMPEFKTEDSSVLQKDELRPYLIPAIGTIESISASDYYQKGITHWHPVLAKYAYELPIVNTLYETALKNKTVVLFGGRFTGKTTALMQLALKAEHPNKFYIKEFTAEQAKYMIANIGTTKAWIFFQNCTEDIQAFQLFSKHPNLTVIGTANEDEFESTKHILARPEYTPLEMEEMEEDYARALYDYIPSSIRENQFIYKSSSYEKFSMLEMISNNVRDVPTGRKIQEILMELHRKDIRIFDVIMLAYYLSDNGSALSTDIMFSFFSLKSYQESISLLSHAKSLLNEYEFALQNDELDQDFFTLRSKLFLLHTKRVLRYNNRLQAQFSKTIKKFIYNVSPYKIFRYDVFKRSAFEATFFHPLFKEDADGIYTYLYDYDKNPYILQHRALSRSMSGRYSEAFVDIDRALNELPYNFSVKNTRAIILFEANKGLDTQLSLEKMKEAMEILRICYFNDKKKAYHAQKFAEFSLFLAKRHSIDLFLGEAREWIDEISKDASRKTRGIIQIGKQLREHYDI